MNLLPQFLCQLLLRCSSNTGCFNYLLNLDIKSPEIISVDHFPILSAVAGVLIALLADETRLNPGEQNMILYCSGKFYLFLEMMNDTQITK